MIKLKHFIIAILGQRKNSAERTNQARKGLPEGVQVVRREARFVRSIKHFNYKIR